MNDPSPKTHLYRLGILLVGLVAVFLVVKEVATPASWNYDVWYRGDSLSDITSEPLSYGENASCKECHKKVNRQLRKRKHKGVACEACHGTLADHAEDGKKTADAIVDKSRWQCENCHLYQINRPKGFPQFPSDVEKHKTIKEGEVCLKCHEAHDPTP